MKIEQNKVVYLDDYDLIVGFACPECGKTFRPNGTGPTNMSIFARLLKGLPSELVTGGIPARFHDSAYLLCPAGWRVVYAPANRQFVAVDKISADKGYYKLIQWVHKDAQGLAAAIVWIMAKRNYLYVKWGGKSSFRHEHNR